MPRIRVAVNGAMAEVDQAANAAEKAADWATAIMHRVWEHGVEIDLVAPEVVRAKLRTVRVVGGIVISLLDALDGSELRINLGDARLDD